MSNGPEDRPPIDPFEAARARRRSPDINVAWCVRDLEMLRPDWSKERCAAFMRRHGAKFATGMLKMGMTLLGSMAADPRFSGDDQRPSGHGDGEHLNSKS